MGTALSYFNRTALGRETRVGPPAQSPPLESPAIAPKPELRPGRLFSCRLTVRVMCPAASTDERGAVPVERLLVWGLAILVFVALAGLVVGPGADLRTDTPDLTLGSEYNAQAGTVRLVHAGGDEFTGLSTDRLRVVAFDSDQNESVSVVWANESRLPVDRGAQFILDDPTVDTNGDGNFDDGDASVGFHFEAGDRIAVVWTGRTLGAPGTRTATLDTVTLGNATSA